MTLQILQSPDEKLKARKKVKNKFKSKKNVVVARPAFLKKVSGSDSKFSAQCRWFKLSANNYNI